MKKVILGLSLVICSVFANEALIKECEAGNAKACHNVGLSYYENKDFKNALDYFKKGCEKRAAKSCFAISEMYHKGEGVTKSAHEAIIYIEKACDESDDPEFCDQMDRYDI